MATGVCSLALLLFMCCQSLPADALVFPGFPSIDPSGETEPPSGSMTNYLKEGDKLEITCKLINETWQRSCNASHMSLRLFKQPLDAQYYMVGTQTPTGPYTIRLLVEKASANESGTYYCYCHNTSISFTKVIFSIGAPPEKPVIVKIIVENMENLTVIVDPVRNDSSLNNDTTWSLHLNWSDNATSVNCGETTEPFLCEVPGLGSRALVPTDLTINASNTLGSSDTERPGERLWHYVRPVPVTAHVQTNGSFLVRLTWSKPAGLETFRLGGLLYQVNLLPQSVFSPVQLNFTCAAENETSERDCLLMEKDLEVHPHTNYNLSLRSRPIVGGHWSAPTVLSFTTDEDVPRVGPGMQPWRYTAAELLDGTYRTVIYPKELLEGDKAGVITHYELEYQGQGWNETQRVEGTPAYIELLPRTLAPDSGVTLRLWAHTAKGRSLNASFLTLLPRNSAIAGSSWLDVERVNSSLRRLFWEPPDQQPNSQVQLHWCWGSVVDPDQAPMVFCWTDISSRPVEGGSNSTLSEGIDEDACGAVSGCSLHFGLSVERGGTSSGIVWNTCIFNSNEVAAQLTNIQVSGSAERLVVDWEYPCHVKADRFQARPLKFESRFSLNTSQSATSDCNWSEDTKQTEAKHGKNSHLWTGLEAEKPYLFCVRSIPENSQPGSWAVKVHSISAESSQTTLIAVTVSVAVLVGGLLFGSLWFVFRKLRSGKLPITSVGDKQRDIQSTEAAMYDYIPPLTPILLTPVPLTPAQKTEVSEPTDIAVTDKAVTDKIQNGHCPLGSGIETGSMSSEAGSPPSTEEGVEPAADADETWGYGLAMVDSNSDKSGTSDDGLLINSSSAPDAEAMQSNVNLGFIQDEDSETKLQAATSFGEENLSTAVSLPRDKGRASHDPGGVPVLWEEEGQESSDVSHGSSSSRSSSNNMPSLPKGYVRQSNHDGKTQAAVRQRNVSADKPDLPASTNAGVDVSDKQLQLQAVKSKAENQTNSGDTLRETNL